MGRKSKTGLNLKAMTPQEMRDLAGVTKDKKLANHLRYQADFKESGGLTRKQQKAAGWKSTTSDPMQGLLPGFTDMVAPRIDEVARDLVFNALQKAVGQEVSKVLQLVKKQA